MCPFIGVQAQVLAVLLGNLLLYVSCGVNEMGNIEQMHNSRGEPNAVKEVRSDAHFANVNETGNKVQN